MAETQFETDAFLKLLTEALRAGPGSPQWHEAVVQLRAANPAEADEYRLLIAAREGLESGREYRSVRAGPGFTRKVMEAIDRQEGGGRMISANSIALLAAGGILAVVVVVGLLLYQGSRRILTVEDLQQVVFTNLAVPGDFSQAVGPEWKKFGVEPAISPREKALRSGNPRDAEKEHLGGGVHLLAPIAAEQAFSMEVIYRNQKPGANSALQVFITDDPSFTPPANTTPSELAVDLRDGVLRVFTPDGKQASDSVKVDARAGGKIVVKVKGDFTIIESDGKGIYAGKNGLGASKARYPGVRFLTRGGGSDDLTVSGIRILKPS